GFASTVETVKFAASMAFLRSSASAPEPISRRWIFLPSAPTRRASKLSPRGVVSVATSDQYSRGTNFSISSSRSQTSRSATDCTRPAERAPGNLRHSTGESVKPAIGSDNDEAYLSPAVISSALKRVDRAVAITVQRLSTGQFKSGQQVFSTQDDA